MSGRNSLFQRAVEISTDYLGPAAERFVARQIETHLNKPPEKLAKSDINELSDWIRLSFALLTNDKKLVDEYTNRILDLAN